MEGYKNIKSINDVKNVLEGFQGLYREKDLNRVDHYVDEVFSSTDGLAVLGSSLNQWCFNLDDIKALIKSHFATENTCWKDVNFKFEEVKVFANENTAWVVSIGAIKDKITEAAQIENSIEKVKEILAVEEMSKTAAINAAKKMANAVRQFEQGEDYIWPFRFTAVLIKEKDLWKFHQMQLAFDSESWPYRLNDEDSVKAIFEMPETASNADQEGVRKTLQIFQEGYVKRDVSYVDEYMKEVFLMDEDLVVIGTDADELCLGTEATRGIIESDWKYWGDFNFNVDNAVINVIDDVAYFTTKAFLKRNVPADKFLQWVKVSSEYTFNSDKAPKQKLLQALFTTLDFLFQAEQGEIFFTPMRFSGVLLKKDEKWLIQHLQYSDYNEGIPEVRKF